MRKRTFSKLTIRTATMALTALVPLASVMDEARAEPATSAAGIASLTADAIVARVVEADPLALGGAEVKATMHIVETSGRSRKLSFDARSRRHEPPLSKSIITFHAPADVAGMKFLQTQRKQQDDERFLYTPELGRARRIAASTRGESFMGSDFSYADLDSHDLRESRAKRLADETCGGKPCFHLDVTPTDAGAVYGRIELWVRTDNFVPVAWSLYDKQSVLTKRLIVSQLSFVGGRWFVTKSTMTTVRTGRASQLVLDHVVARDDIPLETFAVRALERG